MGFKVGDKVVVANVDGIMYGKNYFKDGEIAEIARVEADGSQTYGFDLLAPAATDYDERDNIDGVPSLFIMSSEFQHLVKVLPDNKGGVQ